MQLKRYNDKRKYLFYPSRRVSGVGKQSQLIRWTITSSHYISDIFLYSNKVHMLPNRSMVPLGVFKSIFTPIASTCSYI